MNKVVFEYPCHIFKLALARLELYIMRFLMRCKACANKRVAKYRPYQSIKFSQTMKMKFSFALLFTLFIYQSEAALRSRKPPADAEPKSNVSLVRI